MCKQPWIAVEAVEAVCFKRYRIEWRAQATGFRSHGSWFPADRKPYLESLAAEMNAKYPGVIFHWVWPDTADLQ